MELPDTPIASRFVASPNHGERQSGVDAVILHYTGMADGPSALSRLCEAASEVSCHYLIEENGQVLQLVAEHRRAWHAGQGFWAGETDMNSCSIGIELVNCGHLHASPPPFADRQIESVIRLCADITHRHGIAPQRILAHSDIAPIRKQDPGEMFPWHVLYRRGIGHYATTHNISGGRFLMRGDSGEPVAALQSLLALYGYGVEITGEYDEKLQAVVTAFQRHFRPICVDGIADISTIATLRDLLATVPSPTKIIRSKERER